MDVLRRNTDYGMRIMVMLARNYGQDQYISARQLSEDGYFSYELGCKLLQKLHKAGMVQSVMGPKGGFALSKDPSEISLMDIVRVLQDGISLNRCLIGPGQCKFQRECKISQKLDALQMYMKDYMANITLDEVAD